MSLLFLDYRKVDYERNYFLVYSTCNLHTHNKNSVQLLTIIGNNRLFARFLSSK